MLAKGAETLPPKVAKEYKGLAVSRYIMIEIL